MIQAGGNRVRGVGWRPAIRRPRSKDLGVSADGLVVGPGGVLRKDGGLTSPSFTALLTAVSTGSTAAEVEQTIATPIEQELSGVRPIRRRRSRAWHDGSYRLDVFFFAGTVSLGLDRRPIEPALDNEAEKARDEAAPRSDVGVIMLAANFRRSRPCRSPNGPSHRSEPDSE